MPGAHDAFAKELRDHPGEYAVWKTYEGPSKWDRAGPAARSVRTGRVRSFMPAGHYECTARSEGGKVVIYVRYVGAEDQAQTTERMASAMRDMAERLGVDGGVPDVPGV